MGVVLHVYNTLLGKSLPPTNSFHNFIFVYSLYIYSNWPRFCPAYLERNEIFFLILGIFCKSLPILSNAPNHDPEMIILFLFSFFIFRFSFNLKIFPLMINYHTTRNDMWSRTLLVLRNKQNHTQVLHWNGNFLHIPPTLHTTPGFGGISRPAMDVTCPILPM